MTKSRISMVVAAAGLVLVGLLAAALFSPGSDEPETDETAKKDDIKQVDPAPVRTTNVLGYDVVTPPLQSDPTPKPEPKPQPEVKPAPKPEVKPEAKGGIIEHKIKAGDMISKLASQYGCKVEDIYKANEGLDASNAHKIRVGQTIRIPTGGAGADVATESKPTGDWFPARSVTAEAGDTAYSLAVQYYGNMYLFRKIVDANPGIKWDDRLKGGESVSLPEHGTAPASSKVEKTESKPAKESVARDSLIPPRK
ncbi:MAG: LysM peptidoglycan-binding domain-containing protein [Planctomycetes bacterium]|nr:LysM peptidoglycan-binding domain-containing protein [Planctomycetota bacterium]MCW8136410.1 LysM peptidoglycan-binding domain-containing protein [Planctomycetota bacterium]